MKKIIALLLFGMMVNLAQAQQASSEADAETISRQLTNDLQLSEFQYQALLQINEDRLRQKANVSKMYANDPATRDAQMVAIEEVVDRQMAQVLSQEQLIMYLELQGRSPVEEEQPARFIATEGEVENAKVKK